MFLILIELHVTQIKIVEDDAVCDYTEKTAIKSLFFIQNWTENAFYFLIQFRNLNIECRTVIWMWKKEQIKWL